MAAHLSWEWTKEIKDMIMKPMGKYNQIDLFIISSKDDAVLLGPKERNYPRFLSLLLAC